MWEKVPAVPDIADGGMAEVLQWARSGNKGRGALISNIVEGLW
jgi:hypothetical protein